METGSSSNRWTFVECPLSGYRSIWDLQLKILEAKRKDASFPDVALFLEHHPVFTLGRRGGSDNLKVSECILAESNIEMIHVERGGDVTYHGPGQLVGYPIIHLKKNRLGVVAYVEKLEEAMIETAKQWKIPAGRNALNRGVWVKNRKLGSIGIAVRRGISFHGFSMNVNLSLAPYDWIHPCGLKNVSMTSLASESSTDITVSEAKAAMKNCMADIFQIQWKEMAFEKLLELPALTI